jgi:hypothetical protein
MAEAEYAFLTGLTGFGEIQTQSETSRKEFSNVGRIENTLVAISVLNICSLSKKIWSMVLFI